MTKLKGSVGTYLTVLEEEIERAKSKRTFVPHDRKESIDAWDAYIAHLENLRVESCLLMEFEEDDVGEHGDTVAEVFLLGDEDEEA